MASKDLSQYTIDPNIDAEQLRIGIVVSEWHPNITEKLLEGATETLKNLGIPSNHIKVDWVPGSFELIYGAHKLSKGSIYDAVIAIGSVIRGETPHFDYVCSAVAHGIKDVNILTKTPTIFCVLTDDTEEQAMARSGGKLGNKGVEAAVAAVKMASFKKKEI